MQGTQQGYWASIGLWTILLGSAQQLPSNSFHHQPKPLLPVPQPGASLLWQHTRNARYPRRLPLPPSHLLFLPRPTSHTAPTCFQVASLSLFLFFSIAPALPPPPISFLYPRSVTCVISQGDTLAGACLVLPHSCCIISQFIFHNSKSLPFLPAKLGHFSGTPRVRVAPPSLGHVHLPKPGQECAAWLLAE